MAATTKYDPSFPPEVWLTTDGRWYPTRVAMIEAGQAKLGDRIAKYRRERINHVGVEWEQPSKSPPINPKDN